MEMVVKPAWLEGLMAETFFGVCGVHESRRKNEKNVFCLLCCLSICPHCLPSHRSHPLLQVLTTQYLLHIYHQYLTHMILVLFTIHFYCACIPHNSASFILCLLQKPVPFCWSPSIFLWVPEKFSEFYPPHFIFCSQIHFRATVFSVSDACQPQVPTILINKLHHIHICSLFSPSVFQIFLFCSLVS